ncbi:hypothetical protein IQ40_11425 [Mycobacterium tuberculosis]|nr:hypothetical protein IQ40_11425 [Mycobacterium tuberculosis]
MQSLTNGARSYVVAEATSAAPLQDLLGVVNAPAQALLGRPLIGNGALTGPTGRGLPVGRAGCCLATAGMADRVRRVSQVVLAGMRG